MKHYKIKVFGKVQGVYFRASTQTEAEQLNIRGFVKNESDGSVYIEAEGQEEQLEKLLGWCKTGPRNASVEKVEAQIGTKEGFRLFEIRR